MVLHTYHLEILSHSKYFSVCSDTRTLEVEFKWLIEGIYKRKDSCFVFFVLYLQL